MHATDSGWFKRKAKAQGEKTLSGSGGKGHSRFQVSEFLGSGTSNWQRMPPQALRPSTPFLAMRSRVLLPPAGGRKVRYCERRTTASKREVELSYVWS